MMSLLIYDGKVAVALLVFYLLYRFLLKKETFHRFNRMVLVGTAMLSFLLPLCIITIHKPIEVDSQAIVLSELPVDGMAAVAEKSAPWWPVALSLSILFWAGVAFVLVRVLVSILSIIKIVRTGEQVLEEDGCKVIVTERDIDPFSWMKYIVLSRKDWESAPAPIIAHEKAHIGYGHSVELLFVDVMTAFQWFNPAIWMLRADLRELHEYEADEAVLRAGANIREYQYLLIRKAVGKSGYSVANSFNHSILKNRITMMSKSKSPLSRGLRVLWMLPLVCLGIGLQAQTVYDPVGKDNENPQEGFKLIAENDDYKIILREAWGEEKEITMAEFEQINRDRLNRIKGVEVIKDAETKAKLGFGETGAIFLVTMKHPQELDEISVITYAGEEDEEIPFMLANPETMPSFQGEEMSAFTRWLNARIHRPKGCTHEGDMKVSFVVDTDGTVKDVKVVNSVCETLDALVVSLIEQSPKWEPATAGGRPVAQCLTIPISFRIR